MTAVGDNSKALLTSIVERVETLAEEIKERREGQSEVFQEAKGHGFDIRALRQIIRIRAEDPSKRAEREAILETYMHTLGML